MKRSEDFLLRSVGGQDLLVPLGPRVLDMNVLLTLNATGRYVWELLAEDRSEESLVSQVVDRFDIGEDTARADVRVFLADLERLGLLKT